VELDLDLLLLVSDPDPELVVVVDLDLLDFSLDLVGDEWGEESEVDENNLDFLLGGPAEMDLDFLDPVSLLSDLLSDLDLRGGGVSTFSFLPPELDDGEEDLSPDLVGDACGEDSVDDDLSILLEGPADPPPDCWEEDLSLGLVGEAWGEEPDLDLGSVGIEKYST